MSRPPLYGFDLCTSASSTSVDSARDRITRIGLSTPAGEEIYEGDEGEILHLIDHRMAILPPGILVSWQGSLLDFPLLVRRARHTGLETGIRLRPDRRPAPPSVIVGLEHPWCSAWYSHQHLELRRVYDTGERWWNPMRNKLDTELLIPLPDTLAEHDPAHDARLARSLAERRWSQARKFIDRMPPPATWTPPTDTVDSSADSRWQVGH